MEITDEIQDRAEYLQDSCQSFISQLLEQYPKVSAEVTYDSMTTVWTFNKLAELELRIEKLEKQKEIDDKFKSICL